MLLRIRKTDRSSMGGTFISSVRIATAQAFYLTLVLLITRCAGGIPSIPNDPETILNKGKEYFERGKYFQAQELFKGFLTRHPGHDKSDFAQFMLAESYFEDEEYPLAAVEYRVVISDYGYSEYVDDAFFKEAICFYKQAPKSHLDQTMSFKALELLRQFVKTFNKSPLLEEANRSIGIIHEKLAKKDFKNAMFYMRHKNKRSAGIYLDKIIESYPGNDYWARALYFKGLILLENGDDEDAAEMFERVLDYHKELDVTTEARGALERLKKD